MSARQGKIARLPYEIREDINKLILDGLSYADIIQYIRAHHNAASDINPQNLSNWRNGGFKDWLKENQRLEQTRQKAELLRREMDAGGSFVLDRGLLDIAQIIVDSEDLDPVKAAYAISSLKSSIVAQQRADLEKQKVELAKRNAELETQKFRMKFAETFLKFYEDRKAREIADSDSSSERKIQALLAYMEAQQAEDNEA